ncbi:bifunctional UDP-N-acetylglucosamine diphosphorylase/glucosamine-1-phosphate N-acetyltransferase GlmU [Bombella sp. TMW 2.2559]|uniref:Bifunctional protein GlmU n=1 Tax=Bombella dulcis TaxID=2967339 RepID=A0ABT3W9J6_9PROT|nr:bifunctional UDP-N-acetylglucosamine diphosphorylase/glucosamine-1-phosphate N-acetyltransferase GlmU [Bombella dulcis]MCX5615772.1 bifunctional UDP-N-acetylglucosamine diphosphorylase/glucosamine-1-phosphate N-acetyltransferase GlmU [Bombella dulcis]
MSCTTTAVILAAGMGTRMKSRHPKAMQRLGNRPMIWHLIETAQKVVDRIVVVVGPDMDDLTRFVAPHETVIQAERLGTGHAARIGIKGLDRGKAIILYADNPLLTSGTMKHLLDTHENGNTLSLLGMRPQNPGHYGRIVTENSGQVKRIVEYKDASDDEKQITLCNAGMMCASVADLKSWLNTIAPNNAQKEYYLTDIVALASKQGKVSCVEGTEEELSGINSRQELAQAEIRLQARLRQDALKRGVTLIDPASTFLDSDTKFSTDVVVEPNVFIGPGVTLEEGCTIRAFSHLEGCTVKSGAVIGPYARLRPGTICRENSHVGNFVELKNTDLGAGGKANHLTYLGDARIGSESNIGAGSITCNYDGVFKHQTIIGKRCFIGSNSVMVAPIEIGDEAVTAAGSVITDTVPSAALAFGRARQENKKNKGLALQQALRKKKEQG